MDAPEFCDLIAGMNQQFIADYLRISPKTLQRYKSGATAVPHSTVIALRLKLSGDLAALAGPDWAGFILNDGRLYLPGWRGGFEPQAIRAMFFQVQQVRSLESQIRELERRESNLEADISAALKQASYYRRLVRLESSMGMMLEKMTA